MDDLLHPAELAPTLRRLHGFVADPTNLWDRLRQVTSDETLRQIAAWDDLAGEEHFSALKDIAVRGLVPPSLSFVPHEAVSLFVITDGTPGRLPPETPVLTRMFCITLLLLTGTDLNDQGIMLTKYVLELGAPWDEAAEEFFAWHYETSRPHEDDTYLSLWLIALIRVARTGSRADLPVLTRAMSELPPPRQGFTVPPMAWRYELWDELTDQILWPRADEPEVAAFLEALGRL